MGDIARALESAAPRALQEDYDNSGLLVGSTDQQLKGVLLSLDVTEEVLQEAVHKGCNMVVAHHPIIFSGLKNLTGQNHVQRCVQMAIKNDIAIYAIHTNLDNVLRSGVNEALAKLLGLEQVKVLSASKDQLVKMVTFVPVAHAEAVRQAMFQAGAGHVGEYDACTFNLQGTGTFRPSELANPRVGERGAINRVAEERIELIMPAWREPAVLKALKEAHPYEEVAYNVHALKNDCADYGAGAIGQLRTKMKGGEFLEMLKEQLQLKVIRHTPMAEEVKKVALCGGSGSFLLPKALAAGADVFITGDFKYHQFFDHENRIMIADIGHYESEKHVPMLLHDILSEKFPTFALLLSEVNTNPVRYFY